MVEIEYLMDKKGQAKAVVIPIKLWRQLFMKDDVSLEECLEEIEDYCMNKAMDEAQKSPLLQKENALAYLEKQ